MAFKPYSIGYFDLDLAERRTAKGKLYLFIAIDDQTVIDSIHAMDAVSRRPRTFWKE